MAHIDRPTADIAITVPLVIGGLEVADMECGITVYDDCGNIEIARYWIEGSKRGPDGHFFGEKKWSEYAKGYVNKMATFRHDLDQMAGATVTDRERSADRFIIDMIDREFARDSDVQERAAEALNEAIRDAKAEAKRGAWAEAAE